jgi:hypothetical protein
LKKPDSLSPPPRGLVSGNEPKRDLKNFCAAIKKIISKRDKNVWIYLLKRDRIGM